MFREWNFCDEWEEEKIYFDLMANIKFCLLSKLLCVSGGHLADFYGSSSEVDFAMRF
jgi:hypothetical protein